jgi:predicted Zn-dependent protease
MDSRERPLPRLVRARSRDPFSPAEVALRAQALWQMGRAAAALELLVPAIASFPDSPVLHDVAATVYVKLSRYEDAIVLARRAVALRPQAARPYMRLADIFSAANRPHEAREPALTALRLEPGNSVVMATASEALRRCGEVGRAMELAERATQMNPDRHAALLGRVLLSRGRWQEAEAAMRRAMVVYPDAWMSAFYLALALLPQEREDEARQVAERFLGAHPDDQLVPLLWDHIEDWGSVKVRFGGESGMAALERELRDEFHRRRLARLSASSAHWK